jgi:hypothetical protein
MAKTGKNDNQACGREKTAVELFQSVATFGFFAAAMFCLGGPLILALSPNLPHDFRWIAMVASGLAGFAIVSCVLTFYCLLAAKARNVESTVDGAVEHAKSKGSA